MDTVSRDRRPPAAAPRCRAVWVAVAAVMAIQAGLLAYAATRHSPTLDEPGHMVAGLSHWEFGRFDIYPVNPPLVRLAAALPVAIAGYEADWSVPEGGPGARPEFRLGGLFIRANGERSMRLFVLARWACIPFTLLGGLFCFLWGRERYGATAGFASLCLWCFDPNVLAHGELITSDATAAALGTGAGYAFWRWLKAPGRGRAAAAGLALGLAELAKMSWLLLFALWPMTWALWRATESRSGPHAPGLAQLAAILLVGLYVLNAGYACGGTFTRLGEFAFVSKALGGEAAAHGSGNRFAGGRLAGLPVPLPKDYLLGVDRQQRDFETWKQPSYLRGEWRQGGWWYYHLYGLLVKVPHGTQALFVMACGVALCRASGASIRDDLVLLLPSVCLIAAASAQTAFSHHFRYVLPAFGPLLVFAGQAAAAGAQAWTRGGVMRAVGLIPLLAAGASVVSSAAAYPHMLGYFNECAGGLRNGHRHMIHSSLDWGQDLLLLKEYAASLAPPRPVYFVGHAHYSAADLGLPVAVPSAVSLVEGGDGRTARFEALCAISLNALCGDRGATLDRTLAFRDVSINGRIPADRIASLPRVGASLVVIPCAAGTDGGATDTPADGQAVVVRLGCESEETP